MWLFNFILLFSCISIVTNGLEPGLKAGDYTKVAISTLLLVLCLVSFFVSRALVKKGVIKDD